MRTIRCSTRGALDPERTEREVAGAAGDPEAKDGVRGCWTCAAAPGATPSPCSAAARGSPASIPAGSCSRWRARRRSGWDCFRASSSAMRASCPCAPAASTRRSACSTPSATAPTPRRWRCSGEARRCAPVPAAGGGAPRRARAQQRARPDVRMDGARRRPGAGGALDRCRARPLARHLPHPAAGPARGGQGVPPSPVQRDRAGGDAAQGRLRAHRVLRRLRPARVHHRFSALPRPRENERWTFARLKELLFARGNSRGEARPGADARGLRAPGKSGAFRAAVLHVRAPTGRAPPARSPRRRCARRGCGRGSTPSPHLNHFCERIRIGGEPVSEERACELLEEVRSRVPWALGDPGLTFFEIATLMAFLAFRDVQAMVVEVGLGGRLDATNVVQPLACAVTSLGLEHTQYLGPTLSHIAAEKAGIFKPGAPAVSAGQPRGAAEVLQRRATRAGNFALAARAATTVREPRCQTLLLPRSALGGARRRPRAQRASPADKCRARVRAARSGGAAGPSRATWARGGRAAHRPVAGPARALWKRAGRRRAQPACRRALARSLAALGTARGASRVRGAAGQGRGRDAARACAACATVHSAPPIRPARCRRKRCARAGPGAARTPGAAYLYPTAAAALEAARRAADPDGTVLCCGSLYLAAEVRALLLGQTKVPMPSERL